MSPMLGPTCPKCAVGTVVLPLPQNGKFTCTSCGFNFEAGLTPEKYKEQERQKNKDFEEAIKRQNMETRAKRKARREQAKKDPVFRSTEYLKFMKSERQYGRLHHSQVYVIELKPEVNNEKSKYKRFPSKGYADFCPITDAGFKGYVYVGVTSKGDIEPKEACEKRFKEHKDGRWAGRKIVTKFSKTETFETCGLELTERYGMYNMVSSYPTQGVHSEYMESWVGFMLYKLGYHVWGPHAHSQKHRETYGTFLGKDPYI